MERGNRLVKNREQAGIFQMHRAKHQVAEQVPKAKTIWAPMSPFALQFIL